MKKRRLISVLLCISLFFAGGCGQKTAEKQPEIQETAEQTAKETHKAEQGTRQESVQGNTPEAGQEEAVTVTGAAAALPMLVDYDYEAEYDQDSYETLISIDIPKILVIEEGHDALCASLEEWNQKTYKSQMGAYKNVISDNRELWDEGAGMTGLSIEGNVTFTRADSLVLSYYMETNEWLGGAHPYSFKETCNYDVKSGEDLKLSDVVSDYDTFYKEVCAKLEERKDEYGFYEDYPDTVKNVFYGDKEEYGEPLWTLSGDGITVYFNTYVLAPYASGEQAVSLSFTEYPELIRKQYQKNSDQWAIPIAEGEICPVDLDADGTEEEISYSADRDEYDYADSIVIHCDGNSYDTAMFMDSDYYGGCGYSAYGYLVRTQNGKTWLYLETMGEGDGKYLQIFELMKNDVRFVTADYLGIDPNQPFDPESFVLSKRFDILGTYEAYKKFHVGEDGIPKTEDLLWTIVSTYTDWKVELTSSIDMELSVREANTKRGSGQKETLPAGTHFVLLKTDGEAYADAMLDDGRICEFELEHPSEDEWEGRINGVSISDCFEYVPYAG